MPSFDLLVPGAMQQAPGSNPLTVPGDMSFGGPGSTSDPRHDPSNLDAVSRSILTHIAAQGDRLQQLEMKIRGARVSSETNMSQQERMKQLGEAFNIPAGGTVLAGGQALELTPVSSQSSVAEGSSGSRSTSPLLAADNSCEAYGFAAESGSGATSLFNAAASGTDACSSGGGGNAVHVAGTASSGSSDRQPGAGIGVDGSPAASGFSEPLNAAEETHGGTNAANIPVAAVAKQAEDGSIAVTTPAGNIVRIEEATAGETIL